MRVLGLNELRICIEKEFIMILLKVIFYIIVFFPFLGTAFVDQETVKTRNEETFTEPLKDLAEAEFINNERASGWRSLSITHISDKLQNQCPTSYMFV